ncbi:MAG: lipopolysaccharide heptosyltransferase family protein [Bacteroidia bacterium]|nr:lipopolysaccharide heptosyltransferase family protein [Bacteroidia bacterium]
MNFDVNGVDCKHFNGYKPCFPGVDCSEHCMRCDPIGTRILIINLDAMGDVVMTTAQLAGIKRAWPISQVFWITRSNAAALLHANPLVDRVFVWNDVDRLILQQQFFDVVLNADKSLDACAFASSLWTDELRGFTISKRGQIVPANPEAEYNFRLGLDDHLKFRVNQRSGQDILAATWKLDYRRDEYILELTASEQDRVRELRARWVPVGKLAVGFNTGCSELFPNKKMTVPQHVELIERLASDDRLVFLLLGGPEDTQRNDDIAAQLQPLVHSGRLVPTPTREGLRAGIVYEALADVVITGDSFGMHLAIGLKKHVLAWFGLSCWSEIDLYDRGEKFIPHGLDCAPCWKRTCPYNLECISMIDLDAIAAAVRSFADGVSTIASSSLP